MTNLWNIKELPPEQPIKLPGETVTALFWNGVKRRGPRVWLREKKFGIWHTWTWDRVGEAVREVANGLLSLGLARNDVVSILANTVVEWILADLGTLSCGGVVSGIYPTDATSQVHYLCEDSSTTLLFVEDEEQLDKALAVRSRLPLLRKIIVFDMKGLRELDDPMVISFDALRELGRQYAAAHPTTLEERIAAVKPEDLLMLIYTSGTTGKPKGAMSSHAAVIAGIRTTDIMLPQDESDERMCFLPLCHLAERLMGEYLSLYTGTRLNFVEHPETVPENVREISPSMLFAVPRVWEKFYSNIIISVKEATYLQQRLYGWAIGVGHQVAERYLDQQPIGTLLKLKFTLARWLALGNVRKTIGIDRARYLYTSAAPISPSLIRWYFDLGIPMFEGWAQTESGGIAMQTRAGHVKLGTVGQAVPGMEARVDPATGELLIRGKSVFMGYLNMPEKTAEAVVEKMKSGDSGIHG